LRLTGDGNHPETLPHQRQQTHTDIAATKNQ
jgi:hypothetical protein